jgi:hypothetical protein
MITATNPDGMVSVLSPDDLEAILRDLNPAYHRTTATLLRETALSGVLSGAMTRTPGG